MDNGLPYLMMKKLNKHLVNVFVILQKTYQKIFPLRTLH